MRHPPCASAAPSGQRPRLGSSCPVPCRSTTLAQHPLPLSSPDVTLLPVPSPPCEAAALLSKATSTPVLPKAAGGLPPCSLLPLSSGHGWGSQPGWGGNSGRTPALPGPWSSCSHQHTHKSQEGRTPAWGSWPQGFRHLQPREARLRRTSQGVAGCQRQAPQPLPSYSHERCVKGKITSTVTWVHDLSDVKQHFLSEPWSRVLCRDTGSVSGQGGAAAPHLCQHRPSGRQVHPLPSQSSPAN